MYHKLQDLDQMVFQPEPVAKVFRGDCAESIHYGSIAVVDSEGNLLYRLGDPWMMTYLRSSAKPFQALAVVESGAAKNYGFTSAEIAIIAGSHSGEEIHIETVRSILGKIGLTEANLQCGVQLPLGLSDKNRIGRKLSDYTAVYHNCSGKHAGMLAMAKYKNLSLDDYLSPEHPVQKMITKTISELCDYPEEKIVIGIDGCSAPVHAMPLYNMAYGFARFVTPNVVPASIAKSLNVVSMAMMDHPEMVGGTGRFDTELPQTSGEKIIAKVGAEALQCMAMIDHHWGCAVKIADGSKRALFPVSIELLYKLGIRSQDEKLDNFHRPLLKNWREIEIGRVEPGFELQEVVSD